MIIIIQNMNEIKIINIIILNAREKGVSQGKAKLAVNIVAISVIIIFLL